MKRFLKSCIVFVLPIVLTVAALELLLRSLPNTYKYKYEWMKANAEKVETIILGNSHTFYGIRPQYLSGNAFNMANSSQGLREDVFLLEYYREKYRHLKTVIVPIAYYSLFWIELENDVEWYRERYYKMYMDYDRHSDLSIYNFEMTHRTSALNKLKTLSKNVGCEPLGSGLLSYNSGTLSDGLSHVKRHEAMSNIDDLHNMDYLKEIIHFCKSYDIMLVLITTPCWHTYYENVNQQQITKMYELIKQIQMDYNVPYLDYLKDNRFVSEDFADPQHLSDNGAEKFTKILQQTIDSLGILQN